MAVDGFYEIERMLENQGCESEWSLSGSELRIRSGSRSDHYFKNRIRIPPNTRIRPVLDPLPCREQPGASQLSANLYCNSRMYICIRKVA